MYSLSTCWNSARHTCGREMLREIRSLGFEFAELSHGIRLSLVPGVLEAVDAGEIRISTLHNFCPLPIGVVYPAPNLFLLSSDDRREQENAWKHSIRTLEMAERVGARLVVLHSGEIEMKPFQEKLEDAVAAGKRDTPEYRRLVEDMEKRRNKRREAAETRALAFIGRLAEVAATKKLLLGIENREAVEEIPVDHEVQSFLRRLPECVRYWHDCGHAQIKQNLGLMEHRFHLEGLAPRLAGLHVHDVLADENGQHDHLPPGTGKIDFAALAPLIKPAHVKVLELSPGTPTEEVRKGFDFIRRAWGDE